RRVVERSRTAELEHLLPLLTPVPDEPDFDADAIGLGHDARRHGRELRRIEESQLARAVEGSPEDGAAGPAELVRDRRARAVERVPMKQLRRELGTDHIFRAAVITTAATTASTVTTGTISTGAPRLAAASRRDTTASLVATAPLAATAATATGVAACRASAGGGILTTGIVGPASRRLGVTAARRASARRADLHDAAH